MAISSISGVNFKGTATPANTDVAEVKSNDTKSSSKTNKVLIGVGGALAVAGTVVGGIMYAKHAKFNKALDKIMTEIERTQKRISSDEFFTSRFDLSHVEDYNKALRNIAKEQKSLVQPKEVKEQYQVLKDFAELGETSPYSLESMIANPQTESAKAVKELMTRDTKPDIRFVMDEYLDACKQLSVKLNVKKSIANGKNPQEGIDLFVEKGLLPKGIKAHTYDLAQEGDVAICNYNSGTGFTEYMARTSSGTSERVRRFTMSAFKPYDNNANTTKLKTYNFLVESFRDERNGTYVVSLKLPNAGKLIGYDKVGETPFYIGLGNNTGKLTPAQKDLIEVGGRLTEEETLQFAKLIKDQETMDDNAIFSLIQHFANDAEFMARPVK